MSGEQRRRAEMFPAPGPRSLTDPRGTGPTTGDERAMLLGFLHDQRSTLELKCAGVESAVAQRSLEPSTLSLLGLVRHLSDVERRWFRSVLAGEDAPPRYASVDSPDGDFEFDSVDTSGVATAWQFWREEVDFADNFTAAAPSLDITGTDGWRGVVSLRWVLIHLIEEYARHNGHADLLREHIDGAIGL